MFQRILVANRGEIALRIFRACREMGIESVAVFSEADRGAAYLDLADQKICIGPPRVGDSYLKIDRLISAAEVSGAEAIHPMVFFRKTRILPKFAVTADLNSLVRRTKPWQCSETKIRHVHSRKKLESQRFREVTASWKMSMKP